MCCFRSSDLETSIARLIELLTSVQERPINRLITLIGLLDATERKGDARTIQPLGSSINIGDVGVSSDMNEQTRSSRKRSHISEEEKQNDLTPPMKKQTMVKPNAGDVVVFLSDSDCGGGYPVLEKVRPVFRKASARPMSRKAKSVKVGNSDFFFCSINLDRLKSCDCQFNVAFVKPFGKKT